MAGGCGIVGMLLGAFESREGEYALHTVVENSVLSSIEEDNGSTTWPMAMRKSGEPLGRLLYTYINPRKAEHGGNGAMHHYFLSLGNKKVATQHKYYN